MGDSNEVYHQSCLRHQSRDDNLEFPSAAAYSTYELGLLPVRRTIDAIANARRFPKRERDRISKVPTYTNWSRASLVVISEQDDVLSNSQQGE